MIITEEYLKSVRPEIDGKSDKYSWNIYRYLKKNLKGNVEVFSDGTQAIIGESYQGEVIGVPLLSLMKNFSSSNYCFSWHLTELPKFLNDYQRIGRCLLIPHDHPWYEGEDKRFTYVNNTRRCNWCGQWQHKEIHKVVKREIREEWRDDK